MEVRSLSGEPTWSVDIWVLCCAVYAAKRVRVPYTPPIYGMNQKVRSLALNQVNMGQYHDPVPNYRGVINTSAIRAAVSTH